MKEIVYVQNKNGKSLMPCKPAKAKHLLKDNKAVVVTLCPFTIQLNWDCEINTQEIIVGLDTGAVYVGCSAVSNNKVLYISETRIRTDISKRMQRRSKYRRNRRVRKLRYRQPRFNNRIRSKGWLPPSLKSKVESTIKIVKKLSKILPVNNVVVEIAKFDTQKLMNPDIEGEQYQKGVCEGYDNVRSYVFERDGYTCQICKKKEGILQTHHVIQRKDGGSDRPDNLSTVHKFCHDDFHKGLIQHKFRKPKDYRQATQVTVLKDFIVKELKKDFDVKVTFGHITKRNRMRLNLPKSHWGDAIAICNPEQINKINSYIKNICIPRGRYQQTKGIRSEKKLPSGKVFEYNQWDKVKIGKQIGFIKGRRNKGYFSICDINNKIIYTDINYKKLIKITTQSFNNFININNLEVESKGKFGCS